jgi:signal transduction histidine kinase
VFDGVRVRLTLLYLAAALALILVMGGGAFVILRAYFQSTTDLALRHKMAHEFTLLGARLPPSLADADRDWSILRADNVLEDSPGLPRESGDAEADEDDAKHGTENHDGEREARSLAYDGELASIFVLPLSADGQLLFDPNDAAPPPIAPVSAAVTIALASGSDMRTVQTPSGAAVRLLTYRLTREDGPTVLQLGRTLSDQERVLRQLLVGLLGLGGVSAVLMAAASWWLAGRSLRPAQRAWAQQQAFIANASHELRTPLTLMHASAEVLLRHAPLDNTNERELIGDILGECRHMTRLVDDLLLLSRLDNHRLQLERAPVALPELFADIQRQVRRLADERGVALRAEASGGTVWADPARLRQVLLILLDNALRHTPCGGTIQLNVHTQARTTTIHISDTGSGIAPEHLPRLFDRFYRGDPARMSASGGTGLGLAIAKALIEAQGGQIAIESQLEHGTRVTLTLPTAPIAEVVAS